MSITFTKLTDPDAEIAAAINSWSNDPALTKFIRPSRSKEELEKHIPVTVESLSERLEYVYTYLIYADGHLVGEVNYQIDPDYLLKKEPGTAWIGILIGEESARGKGIGKQAMQYLEEQIRAQGLNRIELGVFEFNTKALNLYRNLGYEEIGRIDGFTYWDGRMWQDIRMEKYLAKDTSE
ncbi:MAG: GNAT family N-acetyltransferase [Anaerolineae bacterium]|nr:GNAT family N-acetyltransferase [Anaerolineae bacterium]